MKIADKLTLARRAYTQLQTQREREAVEVAEERRVAPGRLATLRRLQADAEERAGELFDAIVSGEIES